MIERIEPLIGTIPDTLRTAALKKTLVPFVGAGVSQLGGCHGWNGFANAAVEYFVQKGKLSHAQFDQISSLPSRVKLSIALDLQKTHEIEIDFSSLLQPTEKKREIGDRAYSSLAKLLAPTFVTTNYDQWLDGTYHPLIKPEELTIASLDVSNRVFHIHGSVTDPPNMILTTANYLKRYASHKIDGTGNHENPFLTFLQKLFELKNVLFIGYSLEELEILEYVLQKGVVGPQNNEGPRHFILQGFFSHEIELARSLDGYFRSLGVGLLPFSKDAQNWEQLIEVLEDLATRLPTGKALTLPSLLAMETLL